MQTILPVDTKLVHAPDQKLNKLERDLAAVGIRSMPRDYVARHKRKALDEVRGNLRHIAPFTTAFFRLCDIVALNPFCRMASKRKNEDVASALGAILVMAFLCGLVAPTITHSLLPLVLTIPFLAGGADYWVRRGGPVRDKILSYWRLVPLKLLFSRTGTYLPVNYRALRNRAKTLPGLRLYVEQLHTDPFLVVVRGRGPFRQKAYIAGWRTGDPRLDTFAD